MTFLGYLPGTKGYLRSPNNVLFIAVQTLFDEHLFPKCPDMHCPGITSLAPDSQQTEHNNPLGYEGEEDHPDGDTGLSNLAIPPHSQLLPPQSLP
jgi:hypothetical protein